MGKNIIILLAFVGFLGFCMDARAQEASPNQAELAVTDRDGKSSSSGLPVPRFLSFARDEAVVRTGPGLKYPMKWVYKRKNMPIEVVQEFDTWRKIRDIDGDDGWVHQALLSGTRYVIVKGEAGASIHKDPTEDSSILALFEANVIAKVEECQGQWCLVEQGGYKGWAQRKFLWGIYDTEDFD